MSQDQGWLLADHTNTQKRDDQFKVSEVGPVFVRVRLRTGFNWSACSAPSCTRWWWGAGRPSWGSPSWHSWSNYPFASSVSVDPEPFERVLADSSPW